MSAGWMRGLVCGVALGLAGAASAQAKPLALLVGVGQYPNLPFDFQLEGPAHDVAALRDVLVQRWGFRAADIKTLVNQEATRERIMAELQALQARSAPGDEVLIYLSGHGTSGLDSGMQQSLNLPVGTGAFVPQDFKFPEVTDPKAAGKASEHLIVGRRDLRPVLEALDRGSRKVWVVADACYSGTLVRSARAMQPASGLKARWLPWPYVLQTKEDQAQKQGMLGDMALAAGAAGTSGPYPYRSVAYLSSAAQGEKAFDIPSTAVGLFPTWGTKPHGAMTDALLHVLGGKVPGDLDGNGLLDLNEVHRSVSEFMDSRSYNQTPQRLPAVAQDVHGLGHSAVLGAKNVATKPVGVRAEVPALRLRLRLPETTGTLPAVLKGLTGVALVGKTDAADVQLERQGAEWLVTAQGGDVIGSWPQDSTESVVGQVRQLAWVHRLRQLAVLNRKAALPIEVDPADSGGRFFVGQKLRFVARPEHQATLLLLNADAQGRVSVLFPVSATEASVLPKGQARFIPGEDEASKIDVTAPEGMDVQLAFAFESAPAELSRLFKVENVSPDDARLGLLERWLSEHKGKFSFASSSLHVVARPAQ